MDPFTAIGLVGNIITFIDFAFEIVVVAKDIHTSRSGTTSLNDELETRNEKLTRLATNLQIAKQPSQMSEDEQRLNALAVECVSLSTELHVLLEKLKSKKKGSTKATFKAVFRGFSKQEKKSALEKRLEECRRLLQLQLTSTLRYVV